MKKLHVYTTVVTFGILFSSSAHAFFGLPITANDIDTSSTGYNYEIENNCIGFCVDTLNGVPIPDLYQANEFYVPYFSDAGISNINSPFGWSYSIENSNDLFNLGSSAGVIHWTASAGNELALFDTLSGFTYSSTISSSVKAPFRLDYINDDYREGDPPIPASPLALAAGLIPITAVPVPASIWLFSSGLLGLLGFIKSKTINSF